MIKTSDLKIYLEPQYKVIHSRNYRIQQSFDSLPVLKQNYVQKLKNEKLVRNLDPFNNYIFEKLSSTGTQNQYLNSVQRERTETQRHEQDKIETHRNLKSVTLQSPNLSSNLNEMMNQCRLSIEKTLIIIPQQANQSLPSINRKSDCRQRMKQYSYNEQKKAINNKLSQRTYSKPKFFDNVNVKISAKRWCVSYRSTSGKRFIKALGQSEQKKCEIASLTKMMTFYTALDYLSQNHLVPRDIIVKIPAVAEEIDGTSAQLMNGDILTLNDLFFALMLPSGNDAAIVISLVIGLLFYYQKAYPDKYRDIVKQVIDLDCQISELQVKKREIKGLFLQKMNENCQLLELHNTQFTTVSGLNDKSNYSTASDVLLLAEKCLDNVYYKQVIRTRIYESKSYRWKNTNTLLKDGWKGMKTGVTKNAGPCFCGYWSNCEVEVLVVVLNCDGMEERWQDSEKLLNVVLQQ